MQLYYLFGLLPLLRAVIIVIEYVVNSFVWCVESGLVAGVIAIAVSVGIVKLVYHLFKGVSRYA